MSTTTLPTDAVALIERLDPDAIRNRLAELDRQSRALRVLLRSALARQRRTSLPARPKEARCAD
jgi:hypothetical protein